MRIRVCGKMDTIFRKYHGNPRDKQEYVGRFCRRRGRDECEGRCGGAVFIHLPGAGHPEKRIGCALRRHALHSVQHDGSPAAGRVHCDHQNLVRWLGYLPGAVFLRPGVCGAGTGDQINGPDGRGAG